MVGWVRKTEKVQIKSVAAGALLELGNSRIYIVSIGIHLESFSGGVSEVVSVMS